MRNLTWAIRNVIAYFLWPVTRLVENLRIFIKGNLFPMMGLNASIHIASGCRLSSDSRLFCESGGSLQLGNKTKLSGSTIKVSKNAILQVGDNTKITNTEIIIEDRGNISIASEVSLNGVRIRAKGTGRITISSGCFFDSPFSLDVQNGVAEFGSKSYGRGTVQVRFGGHFKIGENSGINNGTEVRCHDSVTIGSFCLISYDCLIFDTNTHSTDWEHRRTRILACYGVGAFEVERPDTKPVEIGDDVWIGMRSIIPKGCSIGDRAIIGMGTTVTGIVPQDSVVVPQKPRVMPRNGV